MYSDKDDDIINPESLPIYRKGKEIFDLVSKIADLIPEKDEYLINIKACMLSDAAQLSVKVAGAEAAELYDLKMENAAIIRKAARDLLVQQHSLDMFGFEFVEYYQIVRDLIEEYRLLFIEWVAGFDKWDYIIDRWGLFNPLNEKLTIMDIQYFNISGYAIRTCPYYTFIIYRNPDKYL
jgi:hypothetical protein